MSKKFNCPVTAGGLNKRNCSVLSTLKVLSLYAKKHLDGKAWHSMYRLHETQSNACILFPAKKAHQKIAFISSLNFLCEKFQQVFEILPVVC